VCVGGWVGGGLPRCVCGSKKNKYTMEVPCLLLHKENIILLIVKLPVI